MRCAIISIKKANVSDSKILSDFVSQLDKQSLFLPYNPDERNASEEVVKRYLEDISKNVKSIVYIAVDLNNKVVGFVCGEVSKLIRFSHIMKLNVGVLELYQRQGVAKKLGDAILQYAIELGLTRLEVEIIAENKPSLFLASSFNFNIEGVKTSAIKIDDKYYDVYILSRLLM